jgi:prephenate dehydratase
MREAVDAERADPPRTVAFQGEPGAFSEGAALHLLGTGTTALPCRDFGAVVRAVAAGDADCGLLPAENSLAGHVVAAYDALAASALRITAEVARPIRLFVMGLPDARLDGVRRIRSHPVALAQCTRFLAAHPHIEAIAAFDTAGAAREVADAGDPVTAAVAPEGAAARYGLHVLQPDVQDRADNQTRFYLVAPPDAPQPRIACGTSTRKTALLADIPHEPGSLLRLLEPFGSAGINMTGLVARPAAAPWTYRFIVELAGDAENAAYAAALRAAQASASLLRVLGNFPCCGVDD